MTLTRNQEKKLLDDVAEILTCLKGNGLGASEGMIERVVALERADEAAAIEVRSLRQDFQAALLKVKWWALGYAGGTIGIVYGINRVFPGGTP